MENEILQQILETQKQIQGELKDLKQGQAKLEQGQAKIEQRLTSLELEVKDIRELQLKDSEKLDAVYNFAATLHERQVVTTQKVQTVEHVSQINSYDIATLRAVK